jgi:hypothetical protein
MRTAKSKALTCAALAAVLVAGTTVFAGEAARSRLPLASKNTILSVRVQNINQLIKAIKATATQFAPNAGQGIEMQVEQMFAQLPGVDRDGPAAMLLLDPKKFDDPDVGVFTLKNADAFKQGSKADHTLIVGKLGVVSEDEATAAEVAQEIRAKVAAAIPTGDNNEMVVANADVVVLLKRYKQDIQGGLQVMKMQLGGGVPGMNPDAKPDRAKQMGMRAIDCLGKLLVGLEQQVGQVAIGVTPGKERIGMRMAVEATPGSPFASYLGKARPAERALADYLPKKAMSSSVVAFDPDANRPVVLGILDALCKIAGLKAGETQAVRKVVVDGLNNATGLSATAEVPTKDGGTAGAGLSGIEDRDTARAVAKAGVQLTKGGEIGPFLAKYGVTVDLTEKHREYAGIPIDKFEVKLDFDKLFKALPMPPDPDAKKGMTQAFKMAFGFENKMVFETAYGKHLSVTTYGINCDKLMNGQIDLMKSGGADGLGKQAVYRNAISRHPGNAFLLSHTSFFGIIDNMAKMAKKMQAGKMGPGGPGMPMNIFPTRDELPPDEEPITASMRTEGTKTVLVVDIPVKPISDFFRVVKRKTQEMMQQMMQQMQQGPPPGMM